MIKELIENSIDSESNCIEIEVEKGGLEMIRVRDDGKGILQEDFSLLCARHCTSKIESFSELMRNSKMGFRGEALASMSFVSELEVQSRTPSSPVAYQATFQNAKLLSRLSQVP